MEHTPKYKERGQKGAQRSKREHISSLKKIKASRGSGSITWSSSLRPRTAHIPRNDASKPDHQKNTRREGRSAKEQPHLI
jgi:hypothetical protein